MDALLGNVQKAKFPPPRSLNRFIPPAVEAICLKAMALAPSDRYATAAELAGDLERWLADEPVLAYQEPFLEKAARWARRHRTAVAVSFALLLTVSSGLAISNFLIGREKAKTERNFQRARSAVEEMLTKVGEVELADVPQMEAVRRDLLERALGFYREFLDERSTDPFSKRETGRALGRVGDIRELLGQYVQAESNYREALGLLGNSSQDLETRRALARARANLGVLLKKSNRFVESEKFLREALLDRRRLVAENPENPDDGRALSSTIYQLGTLLARLKGRSQEDEALYREAIKEHEELVSQPSVGAEARRELVRYLNNLGILLSGSDVDAAEANFIKAQKLQDELQAESANNAGFRWQRARTWNNLAILYFKANFLDLAEPAFAKARAGFEALSADFPKVPDYRRELGMTLNNIGLLLQARPSEQTNPADVFRKALEDQRRLVADFPEVPDHRLKLAYTLLHLGNVLLKDSPEEAEKSFREAISLQEKLVADFSQVPEYQAALGWTLAERILPLNTPAERTAALDLLTKAVACLQRAREGNPRDQTYVRYLVAARTERAKVLLKTGNYADLALEAEQILQIDSKVPEDRINAAGFLALSFELAGSDPSLSGPQRSVIQERYATQAIKALRDVLGRGMNDTSILDAPDFKPLKGRPDFEKLREDWKAKGQKASA